MLSRDLQESILERHIFGMAKSPLVLNGAIPRNLELDFLRLVYAVEHFRASGHESVGYIVVLTEAIRERIEGWVNKYDAGDCVRIFVAQITAEERADLVAEKARNRQGNVPGSDAVLASAAFGRQLVETALRRKCLADHPGLHELTETTRPLSIKWDFYGVVKDTHQLPS